jgi:hypothetical protein
MELLADDHEVPQMTKLDGRAADASLRFGRRALFIWFRYRQGGFAGLWRRQRTADIR